MKLFYLVAVIATALLTASPLLLLKGEFGESDTGGVVSWNTYSAAVKSIDPATCGDVTSATIQANFYEGLYNYHYLKRPLEVEPQLADGMPDVSADGLVYTIRIKPGMLYHRNSCFGAGADGRPSTRTVRADDFILSFKRIADYHINTGLAWAFLADRIAGLDGYREKTRVYKTGDFSRYDLPVEGLAALDSVTLRVTLTAPFPQFIYVLAMHTCAPVPREAVDYWLTTADDGRGGRTALAEHERNPEIMEPGAAVGTGPYLLDTWKRKWKIILKANPDYRDEFYPSEGQPADGEYPGDSAVGFLADAGRRVPFISEARFRYMEEEYANWMLFLSKQKDIASIPRETFESVVRPDKDLTDEWRNRGIYLLRFTDPAIYWIVFNMEDGVLGKSKALRQAICLSYDVESEIEVLLNGRARRAVNCVPGSFKGHREAGPGPYYRYDREAAKVKLEEAKKELAAQGLLDKGEIPELRFDLTDGAYAMRLAEFTRQQLGAIGLKIKVVYNDWPTLQRKVNNKQVQMYTMGWHADYPDPENFLQLFYSGNIDKGTNNSNYRNAQFDRLYETIRTMQDTPERTELYVQMIRMISEECPVMLTTEPENFVLYYDWVHNVKPHPIGYGYLQYRRLDTQLRAKRGGRG